MHYALHEGQGPDPGGAPTAANGVTPAYMYCRYFRLCGHEHSIKYHNKYHAFSVLNKHRVARLSRASVKVTDQNRIWSTDI